LLSDLELRACGGTLLDLRLDLGKQLLGAPARRAPGGGERLDTGQRLRRPVAGGGAGLVERGGLCVGASPRVARCPRGLLGARRGAGSTAVARSRCPATVASRPAVATRRSALRTYSSRAAV